MPKLAITFRNITLLILLIILIYVYAGMPEKIALFTDSAGNPSQYISRNQFFYFSLLTIVIVNGLFLVYSYFAKSAEKEDNYQYLDSLRVWANGLLALVNIFFITALIFLSAFNSLEQLDLYNFGLTIYIVLGLISLWTLGIIHIFLKRKRA